MSSSQYVRFAGLKMSFWWYILITHKHNQKPPDMLKTRKVKSLFNQYFILKNWISDFTFQKLSSKVIIRSHYHFHNDFSEVKSKIQFCKIKCLLNEPVSFWFLNMSVGFCLCLFISILIFYAFHFSFLKGEVIGSNMLTFSKHTLIWCISLQMMMHKFTKVRESLSKFSIIKILYCLISWEPKKLQIYSV